MNVLVFNCGSSSLKYALLGMPAERLLAGGEAQRVGPPTALPPQIVHRSARGEEVRRVPLPDHAAAFDAVLALLAREEALSVEAIAHRVVHGGERFGDHAVVDERALSDLRAVERLAPIHNPPATRLIEACRERAPHVPQVVVFDTAFHATIPPAARTYALPAALREGAGLRKYGFHGTSHGYVVEEAARFLGVPVAQFNAVCCHLGSGGASLCAVVAGKSVDNTMGYSPLQGLVMSTRSGDLDPAVVLRLAERAGRRIAEVEGLLNKRSGILGLSGFSADIRDVLSGQQRVPGPMRARAAADIYLWRLRKYLGAYLTLVRRPHAVIFTDTIGESNPTVRLAACAGLEAFGVLMDAERNASVRDLPADVAMEKSAVRIVVVRTNEELAIAREAVRLLGKAA